MQIAKPNRWLYVFVSLWVITLLTLGLWWLYVAYSLAQTIEKYQISNIIGENFYNMIKWEGIFFFFLLLIISFVVIFLFLKDIKKSQALQNFFASLTHEQKTPLANIKMQADFLDELLQENEDPQIKKCLSFLTSGTHELEEQFDNMLQLSMIEQGRKLPLEAINLQRFLNSLTRQLPYLNMNISLEYVGENFDILADKFALKVILRNLLENTKRHCQSKEPLITIKLKEENSGIQFDYKDSGKGFEGDSQKLGELFYKFQSHEGTGIGLYLIKKISKNMNANFNIRKSDNNLLSFHIEFKKPSHDDQYNKEMSS